MHSFVVCIIHYLLNISFVELIHLFVHGFVHIFIRGLVHLSTHSYNLSTLPQNTTYNYTKQNVRQNSKYPNVQYVIMRNEFNAQPSRHSFYEMPNSQCFMVSMKFTKQPDFSKLHLVGLAGSAERFKNEWKWIYKTHLTMSTIAYHILKNKKGKYQISVEKEPDEVLIRGCVREREGRK